MDEGCSVSFELFYQGLLGDGWLFGKEDVDS